MLRIASTLSHKGRGEESGAPHEILLLLAIAGEFSRSHRAQSEAGSQPTSCFVDLDADAHRAADYRRVNPQMALPSLVLDDGTVLFQSLAILEYLEETHPAPPLLPADPLGRARVARAGADGRPARAIRCWCRGCGAISTTN